MALSIIPTKEKHRFDRASKPRFNFADYGDYAKFFIRDYLYLPVTKSFYIWNPPNQTDQPKIYLRDAGISTWELSVGVSHDGNGNFNKTSISDWNGATAAEIESGNCSIEGKPANQNSTIVFSLQSGTESFNFFYQVEIEHALVFGSGGTLSIWERGVPKLTSSWQNGDVGLVEKYGNIVRYYLIKADGTAILLRSIRSKLAFPIVPTLTLFHQNAIVSDVRIWAGDEAETTIQNYGVLQNFQDWQNKASWESLGETTVNKDKSEDTTYFSVQKNLKSISLNVAWDDGPEYTKYLEFFEWHDKSKEFIFVDNARHDEFFAKFASGFSDNPLGAEVFGMSAEIKQMINPPSMISI